MTPSGLSGFLTRRILLLGFLLGMVMPLGGWAQEQVSTSPESISSDRAESDWIAELSAIGYLSGSEVPRSTQGVIRHEAGRTAPGLNLMTSGHGPVAILIDMQGTVVHEWSIAFEDVFPDHPRSERGSQAHRQFWRDAVLLPDGDIIVIWELFGIFKLDRDSNVVWAVSEPAHHDLQITESGDIVHLQAERKMIPGIPDQLAIEDFIVTRASGGQELRRVALSDALGNVNWQKLRRTFWKRARERGYGLDERSALDPFHTNSLRLLTQSDALKLGGRFKAGDALVSMGMLDTIAIVDLESGETRWSQQGPFGMQHSARMTPSGKILLFNNFETSLGSSVVALDPRTREVVWRFPQEDGEALYSRRSGGVQVLDNGNRLITETDGGRALEVTPQGEVVWEFHSPYRAGEGGEKMAHLYSLERVGGAQTRWILSETAHGSDD